MSKKSIAVGVYNNPTIQQYLKEGILTSSQINKLIVEEVMSEDDLDEAAGMDTKNIAKIINKEVPGDLPDEEQLELILKLLDQISKLNPEDTESWVDFFPRGAKRWTPEQKAQIIARAKSTKNTRLAKLRKALDGP